MGARTPLNSLLIVAHGSRREASNNEIRALARGVHGEPDNRYGMVECAFLELAEPSIPDAVRQCIERGATRVTVLPYFLSAGRHVVSDIPAEVSRVAGDYPDIPIRILPYLGAAGALTEFILQQAGGLSPQQEKDDANPDHRPN